MSITHIWLVSSHLCSDVSLLFGSLCSWIYYILFCMQGFAIPTNYMSVLRDTDRTLPLHESFQQRIAVDQGMLFFAQSQVLQA